MKWLVSILALVSLTCVFQCCRTCSTDDALAIMTFNIRYGTADDGDNRWERRAPLLVQCLKDHKPDILAVQEALSFQADTILTHFPHLRVFGKGRYFNTYIPSRPQESMDGESCRIFYDSDKFELLKEGTFWHSDQPDSSGSITWGNNLPRITTWGLLRVKSSAKRFVVMNTHMQTNEPYLAETRRLLVQKWQEIAGDQPTIMLGDFNQRPDSETHAVLCGRQGPLLNRRAFRDAWQVAGKAEENAGTGHSYTGAKDQNRIDWVLCTEEFKIANIQIIYDHTESLYPSDHYPVLAQVQF